MTKLFLLVKNNLLGFSGLNKVKYAKGKKERHSSQLNLVLFGSVAILFCYYIYMFASSAMKAFIMLNKPEYSLVFFMLICSSYILVVNIFKGPQTIFKFKDYDLLLSLPVSKKAIITSKLVSLYLYNIVFQVIILIPTLVVYLKNVEVTPSFFVMYFLCFLIIPIIPIIIATFLGTMVNYIASKFKFKNLSTILFSIILMAIVIVVNYKLGSIKMEDLVLGQINIVEKLKYFYPLIFLYLKCITNLSVISLLLMIFSTSLILGLFLIILSHYHSKINQSLTGERKSKNNYYKVKSRKVGKALYQRELKRYFASPVYVLNTAVGLVMLLILVGSLAIFGLDKIAVYLKMPDLNKTIQQSLPFIVTLFCTMSCTTHCTISLEGKYLWIIRSLPVKFTKVLNAKIMLNISLCYPVIIICATALNFLLDLSWGIRVLIYITPMIAVLLNSYVGIILDLLFLKLDWDNEVIVVKQRIPALVAIFFGMLIAIIPIVIKYSIKNWMYICAITIIYAALAIIAIYFANKISLKKIDTLN